MKINREGYYYKLKDMEGKTFQGIQFIQKGPHPNLPEVEKTLLNGTTNWEVTKVLFDRVIIHLLRKFSRWLFKPFGG